MKKLFLSLLVLPGLVFAERVVSVIDRAETMSSCSIVLTNKNEQYPIKYVDIFCWTNNATRQTNLTVVGTSGFRITTATNSTDYLKYGDVVTFDLSHLTHYSTNRFTVYKANTNVVVDNESGLMWIRDSIAASPQTTNWVGATNNVRALNDASYAGYNDWRLPNTNELSRSISSYGLFYAYPNTNTVFPTNHPFTSTHSQYVWATNDWPGDATKAWHVSMYNGWATSGVKATAFVRILPVRGGPTITNLTYPAVFRYTVVSGQE